MSEGWLAWLCCIGGGKTAKSGTSSNICLFSFLIVGMSISPPKLQTKICITDDVVS